MRQKPLNSNLYLPTYQRSYVHSYVLSQPLVIKFNLQTYNETECSIKIEPKTSFVFYFMMFRCSNLEVWPDWAIYWTFGHFSKPLGILILPKTPTFLGNFCKGVKIFNFSSEIIFNFYRHLAIFSGHTASKVSKYYVTT